MSIKQILQAKLGKSNAPAPAPTPAPVAIPVDPNIALLEKALQEENYISLASQIQKLTERSPQDLNKELSQLSSFPDYGGKLNYQISDEQIINDYNTSNLSKLNSIVERGNTQIVGIQQRLDPAQKLLDQLPSQDPRRATSQAYIDNLKSDLASVQGAVADATKQVKNFKPAVVTAPEGVKQVTTLREYLQLPEQRASQQLREIDPDSYQASIALGQKYRELAAAPIGQTQDAQTEAFRAELEKAYRDYSTSAIGATTTAETEALRRRIEDEAMAQLSLGAQLGADEQRQYQQAARAAQTVRGNIFGVAPAVEEAVTTGAAGEQRKLARYGAASQFLSSGQATGDALARDVQLRNALQQSKLGAGGQFLSSGQTAGDALQRDIALRDALLQNRLGSASGFLASGPSVYNLSNARTGQQNAAFQNYIQANQALPGNFGQGASTAANFYQTTNPDAPLALQQAAVSLYNSLLGYQASTYGNMLQAQSQQPSGAAQFAQIAGGIGNIASPITGGFKSYTLGGVK
jgi:hypothetical protein